MVEGLFKIIGVNKMLARLRENNHDTFNQWHDFGLLWRELKGEILVNGINPISSPLYEISDMVGAVFQNPRTQFYAVNTTSEIAFGCDNRGMEPEAIRKRV